MLRGNSPDHNDTQTRTQVDDEHIERLSRDIREFWRAAKLAWAIERHGNMTVDRIINVLVSVTLIEMMVAMGLSVTFTDLIGTCKNWRLVIRAALANYVCVPAATVALLLWFKPQPMVSIGFLILAVCPGAPYGPPFTAIAKGNVPIAVGLMAILAGSSAIIAPLLLHNLLLLLSEHEPLSLDLPKVAVTLLLTQLAPLCLGVAVRERWSKLASKLQGPATLISKILNLIVVGLILITQFHLLTDIRLGRKSLPRKRDSA